MAEYAEMIAPKEFRTLEIDVKRNIFKLNGDDLKKCERIDINIYPEESEIYVKTTTSATFCKYPRERYKKDGGEETAT